MSVLKSKLDATGSSRDRILDAAAALFRENGYATVSMRSIAAAAGMKGGSVYYHFTSKEEIIIEVLNLGIEMVHRDVEAAIAQVPDAANAAQLVRAGIESHLRALFEFSAYTSANVRIYGQVPQPVRQANRVMRRRYEDLWESILDQAFSRGGVRQAVDLKAFRLLLIGSLNATLEWFDPAQGEVAELADHYADILLNGLLEPSEGQP